MFLCFRVEYLLGVFSLLGWCHLYCCANDIIQRHGNRGLLPAPCHSTLTHDASAVAVQQSLSEFGNPTSKRVMDCPQWDPESEASESKQQILYSTLTREKRIYILHIISYSPCLRTYKTAHHSSFYFMVSVLQTNIAYIHVYLYKQRNQIHSSNVQAYLILRRVEPQPATATTQHSTGDIAYPAVTKLSATSLYSSTIPMTIIVSAFATCCFSVQPRLSRDRK